MTEHNNDYDFRPLPVGWYSVHVDKDEDWDCTLSPCPGLIRRGEVWLPSTDSVGDGGQSFDEYSHGLQFRPDLAHMPGALDIKEVDGVEHVRPEFASHKRVIGPDTPWPISKMEA
ncbi:hypothetical protein G6020_13450 [Dietzia sp. B19]|uniref:hypothetical protein n=1 Tax=Dietzia sp. B19 TaxID=1630632 RepID=UPI0015FE330A|nr:hypothetical protein [Dietzia sp. B19]MBB1058375.1 hypothetical protein [Dietzia sp. B19]